jgi:hypothetical protein
MKSEKSGTTIPTAEVTGITPFGVWSLVHEEERFLPFEHIPVVQECDGGADLQRRTAEPASPHHL